MNNTKGILKSMGTLSRIMICLLVVAVALSGCEPLRKKFTRKKKKSKKESAAFIPVLDPIEYPAPMVSLPEKYKYRYQLWKVWQKDLATALEEDSSEKKLVYSNHQLLVQLEEMQKLLSEEKQKELVMFISDYKDIGDQLNTPKIIRNNQNLLRRLSRIEKSFKQKFGIDKVEDHLR